MKTAIVIFCLLFFVRPANAEIKKYVGFSGQASAAKIGFSLGAESNFTVENDYVIDYLNSIEKMGGKYDKKVRGFIAQANYYPKSPFDGLFFGVHAGEVVTYSLFVSQLPAGTTSFTPAPTETITGFQVGYVWKLESQLAFGFSGRGSFYGESSAFAFSPSITAGLVF